MTEKAMTSQAKQMHPTKVIKLWWKELYDPVSEIPMPGSRATLARLRHCKRIFDVVIDPAFADLAQKCGVKFDHNHDLNRVALVMAVMSYVRSDIPDKKNARIIGPTKQVSEDEASDALCKPLRFRQLLGASTVDECYRAFRQLVNLMGRAVNVDDLVNSLWNWPRFPGAEKTADKIRIEWVYNYWSTDSENASGNKTS
ncbi:type I-E CRISPR-associated protein Cse2/CasB [Aristophania vespae]|uniref:Type I-E CRISPR-associated protein Cse2/CasB n=1 Tax=Aristophania vespae TaxID=2697033 RepID=A0A6P1NCF9_9PROT|nr:type I-E CRISPR-associated protein Cse2/CasB [Aristophania vespae]QHI95193.1 type I-E CRISPR-associated protein Cse2/CasB [Aristophania vespae]